MFLYKTQKNPTIFGSGDIHQYLLESYHNLYLSLSQSTNWIYPAKQHYFPPPCFPPSSPPGWTTPITLGQSPHLEYISRFLRRWISAVLLMTAEQACLPLPSASQAVLYNSSALYYTSTPPRPNTPFRLWFEMKNTLAVSQIWTRA